MYRTHKGLPAASKISSLYAFDALARAARSQVTKHGISGDIYTQPGNCATFLLKLEGVLDGLFQDMVASASSEAKVSPPADTHHVDFCSSEMITTSCIIVLLPTQDLDTSDGYAATGLSEVEFFVVIFLTGSANFHLPQQCRAPIDVVAWLCVHSAMSSAYALYASRENQPPARGVT